MQPLLLRLTDAEYEWLRRQAFEARRSMAEIVRELIDREMDRHGARPGVLRLSRDEFARELGFANAEALGRASEEIVREGDVSWYVTRLSDGRWAAWDDAELAPDRVAYFSTREEAIRYHREAHEKED